MLFFNPNHQDFADDFDDNMLLHDSQLHISRNSHAVDSDGDGWSDAVERSLGTNPFDPLSHPGADGTIPDDLHISNNLNGKDTDNDGFSDDLENSLGTDSLNLTSHPNVVMPHHFDTNSDNFDIADNLNGTFDIKK